MAPAHIAAWKKLGLKLKNEPSTALPQEATNGSSEKLPYYLSEKKRKQEHNGESQSHNESATPKPKKTKFADKDDSRSHEGLRASVEASEPSLNQTPLKKAGKRKSVSFTPDTKAKDGGPDPEEFLHDGVEELGSLKSPTATGKAQLELIQTPNETSTESTSPRKKKKKSKSTLLQTQPTEEADHSSKPSSDYVPPHLEYLDQYHTNRATWKFNKAKQNRILKDPFNLDEIPAAYDHALREYILGLNSGAMAKRLHDQAQAVVQTDEEEVTKHAEEHPTQATDNKHEKQAKRKREQSQAVDPDSSNEGYKRARYLEAIERTKKLIHAGELAREEEELIQDPTWLKRYYRRRRAEYTLWGVKGKRMEDLQPKPRKIEVVEENQGAHTVHESRRAGIADLGSNGVPKSNVVKFDKPNVVKLDKPTANSAPAVNGNASKAAEQSTRRRRKRKSRSGIPDDDTSSSESSDGDSDSDGSDGGLKKKKEDKLLHALGKGKGTKDKAAKTGPLVEEDTSSSGSETSSDSSDSDSSDD